MGLTAVSYDGLSGTLSNYEALVELRASGVFSQHMIEFSIVATYVGLNAWILDMMLSLVWLFVVMCLQKEFTTCAKFRFLAELPSVTVEEQCSICLADHTVDGCQMPCRHTFHRSCLTAWARKTNEGDGISCPLCRSVTTFSPL